MAVVIDASIAACWAFADESHPVADAALERVRREDALVPALFWFEVRNILVVNERRKRLTEVETAGFLGDLAQVAAQVDGEPQEGSVLRLARAHKLTVYDAAYLELAQRKGAVLATLDSDLARAARAEAVPLLVPA